MKRDSTKSSKASNEDMKQILNILKNETDQLSTEIIDSIKQEFLEIVKNYAIKFTESLFETKDVKRFLGNASFRCPKGFPSFRSDKYIFVSKRNVNKEFISINEFVPVYMKHNEIYYCGNDKPSVDTPIQVRIYEKLPNINYMIHSHCYIKGAPFTKTALPCGAVEEVTEILNLINQYYNNDFTKDFYVINLTGHGSIMMSKAPEQLKDVEIFGRKLPEKRY
ncbi:MAG: class II aldolase/adducin family protein [Bacilli bacterium]|nr:class II aldolase/adducin family protein [Bacilli bacterium]